MQNQTPEQEIFLKNLDIHPNSIFAMDLAFRRQPLRSLKDIALRKTVTLFWMPVHSYKLRCFQDYKNMWPKIEEKIKENVHHVNLPRTVEEQVIAHLHPIGFQILKWIKFHESELPSSHILPTQFCWTQQGTIDLKRTAEIIVTNQEISADLRFGIASTYCLEDSILTLWNEMSESEHEQVCQCSDLNQMFTIKAYWMHIITGDVNRITLFIRERTGPNRISLEHTAFMTAASTANRVATEYFWNKISPEIRSIGLLVTLAQKIAERCVNIDVPISFLSDHYYPDVYLYLMSHMSAKEQIQTVKRCPHGAVLCLRDWPWQHIFIKILHSYWKVFSINIYLWAFLHFSKSSCSSAPMHAYKQQLFSDIWRNMPARFANNDNILRALIQRFINSINKKMYNCKFKIGP